MSRKNKKQRHGSGSSDEAQSPATKSDADNADEAAGDSVSVGQWKERKKPAFRQFPGPRVTDVPLRVAAERVVYADVVAHAKESLEAEICGVLVGTECEDEYGSYVHIFATIRSSNAVEGTVHVTYTQETWNEIHEVMEREYPRLQIVGWYHSHPGFGVEFSEMDIFIQKNFFSGPTQIGLVTDPLTGSVAICKNDDDGICYLQRFWIDGREQQCTVPASEPGGTATSSGGASAEAIESLETRVAQLIASVDDARQTFYRWIYSMGMIIGLVLALLITWQIMGQIFGSPVEPPKGVSFAAVPVSIDGKPCVLGVKIVKWNIPPELIYVPPKEEEEKGEEEGGEEKEGAEKNKDQKKSD